MNRAIFEAGTDLRRLGNYLAGCLSIIIGESVIAVAPDDTTHAGIVSSLVIAPGVECGAGIISD
jgi:hypothetical protein